MSPDERACKRIRGEEGLCEEVGHNLGDVGLHSEPPAIPYTITVKTEPLQQDRLGKIASIWEGRWPISTSSIRSHHALFPPSHLCYHKCSICISEYSMTVENAPTHRHTFQKEPTASKDDRANRVKGEIVSSSPQLSQSFCPQGLRIL